jgi:hypothetical protein
MQPLISNFGWHSLMSVMLIVANGPVPSSTPIIINGFGYTGLNSLLLTMPAGLVSGTIELLASG